MSEHFNVFFMLFLEVLLDVFLNVYEGSKQYKLHGGLFHV